MLWAVSACAPTLVCSCGLLAGCAGVGAYLLVSLECTLGVGVSSTSRCCIIGHILVVVGVACVLVVAVVSSRPLFLRGGYRGRSLFRSGRFRRILAWLRGGLGGVSVDHDEDGVVRFVVAVGAFAVVYACVHDAGVLAGSLVRFSGIRRSVSVAVSAASDEF